MPKKVQGKIKSDPDKGVFVYELRKFMRSNACTCFTQKPVVKRGQVVPPRAVVGGAPAVKLRELQDKDIDSWEKSKQTYIDLAAKCLSPGVLRPISPEEAAK